MILMLKRICQFIRQGFDKTMKRSDEIEKKLAEVDKRIEERRKEMEEKQWRLIIK